MHSRKIAIGAFALCLLTPLADAGPIEINPNIFLPPELISSKTSKCNDLNISSARTLDRASVVMFILPSWNFVTPPNQRTCRIEFGLAHPLQSMQNVQIDIPNEAARNSIVEMGYEIDNSSKYKEFFRKEDFSSRPKIDASIQMRLPPGTNKFIFFLRRSDVSTSTSEIQSITLHISSF